MNPQELDNLIQMLRHMVDSSPYLNQTRKTIIRQKLDDIQTTLHKETFI